jgi:protein subunit release factor A
MTAEGPEAPRERSDQELLSECRVDTFRAGGQGGQHQNKTETGVRLTHEPSGIVVTARESRSQSRNRQRALERLRAALAERDRVDAPRIPTRTPRRAKEQRLEGKRQRAVVKRARRKPGPED